MIEKKKSEDKIPEEEKKKIITKDMKLGEVIRKYPASAAVMMEYGLHCIGCHVAEWESIEEGCMAHGITKEEFEKMLDELNSDAVLEGKIVTDEKEKIEETKQEQMDQNKKGFFRRLHM